MLHKSLTVGDIHIPYQWTYANASLREAATGFVASDVGRLALQLDNYTLWVLSAVTPTWVAVSAAGGVMPHHETHEAGGTDVVPHQSLSGAGTNSHATIDTHLASTSNPHSTTASQVGLGNVTNDAQLKRAAGDFATFAEKTTPVSADLLLIEDSASAGAKKKAQIGNLPKSILQSLFAEVTTDQSTTSTTNVDLLSQSITTGANYIEVMVSVGASSSTNNSKVFFDLVVDGAVKRGIGMTATVGGDPNSGAIVYKMAVTAAAHTVKVQWRVSGNTGRVRPATVPAEHCSLLVKEVTL